jgi:hypothetical protein
MSTRSDVGIALKKNVFEALSTETRDFLEQVFEAHTHSEEGIFFHATYLKWYTHDGSQVEKLYSELLDFDDDDFQIIEACHDYPDSDEGCAGAWDENPWGALKEINVSIDFSSP